MKESLVKQIVSEVLRNSHPLSDDDRLGFTPGWDSLAHVEIISRLEREAGLALKPEDIIFAESLGDLVQLFSET